MALQYTLVFSLLMVEMALFAIISLPLPPKVRKPLFNSINIPFHSEKFQIFFKCIIGFIGVLFVDSLHRMNKVTNELYNMDNGGFVPEHSGMPPPPQGNPGIASGSTRAEIQSRRFYAQRNVYLCGLTLFFSLVVKRTYDLVYDLLNVKEELARQQKGAKLDKLSTVDEKNAKDVRQKIKDSEKEMKRLKKQAEALSKDYESLDKKAN